MHLLPAEPTSLLIVGFVVLSVAIVAGYSVALRSWVFAIAGAVWLVLTGTLGASGILADFSGMPPRITCLLLPTFIASAALVFSRFGKRIVALPLKFLVGFLAFRIPVELLIHLAVEEGVAPPQMTWTGLNFDILAGISAAIAIPFVDRIPRNIVLLWNLLALGLLVWIVGVATLSMPTPLQRIEPDNVWVAYFPFIWLPTIGVSLAFMAHLAIFRKLLGKGDDDA